MIQEKSRQGASGYVMLLVLLAAQLAAGYGMFVALRAMNIVGLITAVLASIIVLIM